MVDGAISGSRRAHEDVVGARVREEGGVAANRKEFGEGRVADGECVQESVEGASGAGSGEGGVGKGAASGGGEAGAAVS